jgi:hypothetical protein
MQQSEVRAENIKDRLRALGVPFHLTRTADGLTRRWHVGSALPMGTAQVERWLSKQEQQ